MINSFNKKINWFIGGLFLIGLFLVFAPFFDRLSFPDKFRVFETDEKISLGPNEPITQIFTATANNLSQIKILMRNDNVPGNEKLTLSILDENCKDSVREAKLSRPNYAPKQYDFFTFEPIEDSENKKYCLSVLWQAEKKRKSQPNISIMEKTGNPEDEFIVHNKKTSVHSEETLIFHPGYEKDSFIGNAQELSRRMSAYKADFLAETNLIIIFTLFILLSFLFIILILSL